MFYFLTKEFAEQYSGLSFYCYFFPLILQHVSEFRLKVWSCPLIACLCVCVALTLFVCLFVCSQFNCLWNNTINQCQIFVCGKNHADSFIVTSSNIYSRLAKINICPCVERECVVYLLSVVLAII